MKDNIHILDFFPFIFGKWSYFFLLAIMWKIFASKSFIFLFPLRVVQSIHVIWFVFPFFFLLHIGSKQNTLFLLWLDISIHPSSEVSFLAVRTYIVFGLHIFCCFFSYLEDYLLINLSTHVPKECTVHEWDGCVV